MKHFKFIFVTILLAQVITHAQTITTFAGNGGTGAMTEGVPATATTAYLPHAGSFDASGNYYFLSNTAQVKKVTPTGIITTVAGGGVVLGDNGPATAANIHCQGMHVDSIGNIYIADYYNYRLRKVDATTGIINTIAGTGVSGSSGNGGPATAANMAPVDVITDDTGNIYVNDNFTIRKINITTNIITQFCITSGALCFDRAYTYLYMGGATWAFRQNMTTGVLDTIGGMGIAAYNGDGIPATSAHFRAIDIALDPSGNIYLADDYNDRIRMIDAAGIIHTVAGNGIGGYGGDNGPATAAQIYDPQGLAFDKCGNLYIADDHNHRIRKVAFNPGCSPNDTPNHVGVENVNSKAPIVIYPNPVLHELCVEAGYAGSYIITNVAGYAMLQGTVVEGKNTIPMGQLRAGIYFIALTGADGERKIVKVLKE